jgi:hypothetical protein
VPSHASVQQAPSVQKPLVHWSSTAHGSPSSSCISHIMVSGLHQLPAGHGIEEQSISQEVTSRQRPVGHGVSGLVTHIPAASQLRVRVMPSVQLDGPHIVPTGRPVQPLVLTSGSQCWQLLSGLRAPAM